jgi:signal transduction histidine kinase
MTERLLARRVERYFNGLRPRAQVILCQLPLTFIVAAVVIAAPAVWPDVLNSEYFLTAMGLHAVIFASCILVPWEKLGPQAPLVIPVLDLAAIWLTRNGAAPNLTGLGVLAIFPVIWLSASGIRARTSLILSFCGPMLIGLPTLISKIPNITVADVTSTVLLPFMMLAVSVAIRFASVHMRLQQRRLEAKDTELQALLAESKERERLLDIILETVDVGIIAVNGDGKLLLSNHQQSLFEVTASPEGLPGLPEESLLVVSGHDRKTPVPADRRPVSRAARGETFADYLVWLGEGAQQRAVSTAARPMKNDDGEFDGAVVVFNDVTGLVEAISAKDEFLSNVSHELRTPLNSVIGNLDLVLDGEQGLPPLAVQRLKVAQRNTERLLTLVSDLLVSASEALHVHPRRTDLAGVVEASLGSARVHAEASKVSLSMDVPAPLWAHVDPLRIGQALDNLVSNAIKYSPDGGTVKVSARASDGRIRLQVEDAGMGMTTADTAKVFTRFYRSPAALEADIPGVGLGLSITKAIVERHGGGISCVSEPGTGSTFTMTLPAEGAPASS